MDTLTTRVLSYADEGGHATDLVLTIFVPQSVDDAWKCGFSLPEPFRRKNAESYGVDFIQALLLCLQIVPSYLRLTPLLNRAHWQGMVHCGLPSHADLPADYQPPDIGLALENPGNLEVLATRSLGCPDPPGATRALTLTVYKPLQAGDLQWSCAVSFGSTDDKRLPVRYGAGADFIESFLDALALARATYATMVPKGWHASKSERLLDCDDFPFKIGRAFHTNMVGDLGPGAPEFFTPS